MVNICRLDCYNYLIFPVRVVIVMMNIKLLLKRARFMLHKLSFLVSVKMFLYEKNIINDNRTRSSVVTNYWNHYTKETVKLRIVT